MAFIGAKPTNVPLTASDITDGSISVAKLTSALDLSSNTVTLPSGVGGKVLQVVQTTKTDRFTTSSSSLVDITGFSVNITPSSSSNKILVMFTLGALQNSGNNQRAFASLLRGSTELIKGDAGTGHEHTIGVCLRSNDGGHTQLSQSFEFLDTPSTTSQITYKVQATVGSDSGNLQINSSHSVTGERANTASTITAMEISA